MAGFMLSAMPFTGHVAPLCVVANELTSRGHDVRVYCGSAFRGRIEASGARFVPWQTAPDFDENDLSATFPRLVGKKGFRQMIINVQDVFIETVPAQMDDLQHEWEREQWDATVADDLSIGASFAAEKLGSPWGTVSVLPLNLASSQGAPSTLGLTPGRNPVTKLRDALIRGLVPLLSAPVNRPIARVRDKVGLPPTKHGMDRIAFSPRLVVASGSPGLDFERTDRPHRRCTSSGNYGETCLR